MYRNRYKYMNRYKTTDTLSILKVSITMCYNVFIFCKSDRSTSNDSRRHLIHGSIDLLTDLKPSFDSLDNDGLMNVNYTTLSSNGSDASLDRSSDKWFDREDCRASNNNWDKVKDNKGIRLIRMDQWENTLFFATTIRRMSYSLQTGYGPWLVLWMMVLIMAHC